MFVTPICSLLAPGAGTAQKHLEAHSVQTGSLAARREARYRLLPLYTTQMSSETPNPG